MGLEITEKSVDELIPYENNPRRNDDAVEYVANSIKEFGFKNPILLDENDVIIAGHTRLKAAKELGINKVPCIYCSDLTEEQVKAFRLADNKVSEKAKWDWDKLSEELDEISSVDMGEMGFDQKGQDFISDLLDENFIDRSGESAEEFTITFAFDKKNEEEIKEYIKKVGKEAISELITEKAIEMGDV